MATPSRTLTYSDLPPSHWVSLSLYGTLIALMIMTTFWPDPVEGASPVVMLSIKLFPLLVFLPGLIVGRNTTYIWTCFVVLVYFMQSSVNAYLHEWAWAPSTVMVVTCLYFGTAMLKLKADPGNQGIGQEPQDKK
ncbi:MAG: DUF2069 domain-containing protein [Halomonadaceae bacterium]|nr:MAG: DUF2069 domain-containing protein [Halomonadaceae bacterium]